MIVQISAGLLAHGAPTLYYWAMVDGDPIDLVTLDEVEIEGLFDELIMPPDGLK